MNGWTKWIALILSSLVILAGVVAGISRTNSRAVENTKDITHLDRRMSPVEKAVVEQSTNIEWIRAKLEKMD